MATRIHSLTEKNFDQTSLHSMSRFSVNCSSWWIPSQQQSPQLLSKNLTLKVESLPQNCHNARHVDLQLRDQDSSSTQSTGQSNNEVTVVGGINPQEQSISSESVQEDSYGKHAESQLKPVYLMGNPEMVVNPSHVDYSHSMAHIPYPYADPYLSGLLSAYGPQAIMQPQMVGMTPARVPLPLDLAENKPIYVNAKQYHGILRRRQSRAKLEALNKLLKTRKPYLHESRHLHALNRVRGSGGRFLSTKKLQETNPTSSTSVQCSSSSGSMHQQGAMSEAEKGRSSTGLNAASVACATTVSNVGVSFQEPVRRFSGLSSQLGGSTQGSGVLMSNGNQHRAPVIR
ncbi:Nuclear transcription factor Y subunit A [Dillenia turbinata]|uniref:Nuclear transcription factor Y subunit n=1 Tax=Dillenia turbinata TaxID=194707 RepID=A0AAN8W2A8_9MAGN